MSIVMPEGIEIQGNEYRPKVGTVFVARQKAEDIECKGCGRADKLRKKSKIKRLVRHLCVLNESAYIEWNGHKYYCGRCKKYFHQRFPGVYPWRRYSEAFRKEMVNLHQTGISQTDIRVLKKVGTATIERWYHELLGRKNREFLSYRYSSHIGIDEHRFSKKVGFSTTLCDLKNNRVLDITKGRSAKEIVPTLKRIPGREQVKMVSLDLSETYRAVAKEVFPNAVLVADRFHVIRLVNQHFLDTWKLLDPSGRHNRGLLSLMRRHAWHLKDSQKLNLDSYLSAFPGLKSIYDFKQDLVRLLLIKHRSKPQCKPLIRLLLSATAQLRNAHFDPLVTLGNTLHNWQSEIAAMWRFTKSNAITEGFHRKMKLIQRRAYGFKNFENYRLRVRVLCSSMNFVFT